MMYKKMDEISFLFPLPPVQQVLLFDDFCLIAVGLKEGSVDLLQGEEVGKDRQSG